MAGGQPRPRKRRKPGIGEKRYERLLQRCRELPAIEVPVVKEFVTNLMITVLDLRLKTPTVGRAVEFYRSNWARQVSTFAQLKQLLESGTPDVELAVQLWGYRYGNRIAILRRLVQFLGSGGIMTQSALENWARDADSTATSKSASRDSHTRRSNGW